MTEAEEFDALLEAEEFDAVIASDVAKAQPQQKPQQAQDGPSFDPNSAYDQTVKRASDVAGGLIKGGVFDLVDMPANLVNLGAQGLNAVGVDNDYRMGLPTESNVLGLKKAKEMLTSRQVPEGVSTTQDMARTASEWVGLPMARAKKAVDLGTNVVKDVAAEIAPDIGAGLAASSGEQIGETLDMPWLEDLSGIVGGVVTGKAQNPSAPKRSKIDDKALQVIHKNATANPATIAEQVRNSVKNDSFGTLGDRANDSGVFAVERGMARRPQSAINAKIAEADILRGEQVIGDVADTIPTFPTAPFSDAANERITGLLGDQRGNAGSILNQKTTNIERAKGALTEAEATAAALRQSSPMLTNAPETVAASIDLASNYKQLAKEQKALADAEWAVFDNSPPIAMGEVVKDFDKQWATQNFAPSSVKKFKKEFPDEIAQLKAMANGKTDPRDVQALLSDVKQELSNRFESNKTNVADGMMRDWVRVLEDTLTTSPTTANWKNAVAATKSRYDKTQPERFGSVLKSKDVETLVNRMGFKGDTGGSTARLLSESGDARVMESADTALRAKAKAEGLDKAFMDSHAGYLNARPRLKAELQAQVDSAAKVDAATTKVAQVKDSAGKRAEGLKKSVQKSTLAEYVDDAPKTLKKILKAGDKVSRDKLVQLAKNAERTGTTDALRTQINEQLAKVVFGSESKLKRANRGSIATFDNTKENLVASGVYTQKEVDRISKSLERVKELDNRKKNVSSVELEQVLTGVEEALASGVAVGALSLTPMAAGLVMTGVVRRGVKQWMLSNKNDPAILKRVEEFIIDPESYLRAIDSGASPDELAQTLIQRITKTAPNVKVRQPITQDEDE